uniref:Uncharacterized protein n=1 Tax=Globodera rostochiensis TaxID=31243 RepID=A0A914H5Y2_GLORO
MVRHYIRFFSRDGERVARHFDNGLFDNGHFDNDTSTTTLRQRHLTMSLNWRSNEWSSLSHKLCYDRQVQPSFGTKNNYLFYFSSLAYLVRSPLGQLLNPNLHLSIICTLRDGQNIIKKEFTI